jgi:hypothetical protein
MPEKQMMAIATIVLPFITKLLFSIQISPILYLTTFDHVKTKSLPVRQTGLPDFCKGYIKETGKYFSQ